MRDYRAEGEKLWKRFNADRDETLWYYRELLAAYNKGKKPELEHLIGEFTRLLDELEGLLEQTDRAT